MRWVHRVAWFTERFTFPHVSEVPKMFGSKYNKIAFPTVAAFMLSVGFGVSSAEALTCPDPAATSVLRLLEISTDPSDNVNSISCLASGTEPGADGAFEAAFPSYDFIGKEEDKDLDPTENEGRGALDGVLDEVVGSSFWSGVQGEFTFTDPASDGAYAILFKFGQPEISDSWFAIKVAGGLSPFNILWKSVDDQGELRKNALSHVTLYGTPAPIPVPAAGLLLLTALGGLGVAARRRRKAA